MRYKKGLDSEQYKTLKSEISNKGLIDLHIPSNIEICLVAGGYRRFAWIHVYSSGKEIKKLFDKLRINYKCAMKSSALPGCTLFYSRYIINGNFKKNKDLEWEKFVRKKSIKDKFSRVPEWAAYLGYVTENKESNYSNKEIPVAIIDKAKQYCCFIKENFPELHKFNKRYFNTLYQH